MSSRIKTKILQRIDSESNWKTQNPVLSSGEIAFVRTENGTFMKVGQDQRYLETPFHSNVIVDNAPVSAFGVVNIGQEEYEQLVIAGLVNENTLYVVSGDHMDAFGDQLKNLSGGTDENDAATFGQLSSGISGLSAWAVSSFITSHQSLSSYYTKSQTDALISGKSSTYVDGQRTDLSVMHISQSDYHELVASGDVLSGMLYIVSSDGIDAYGQRLSNLADAQEISDAVNLG